MQIAGAERIDQPEEAVKFRTCAAEEWILDGRGDQQFLDQISGKPNTGGTQNLSRGQDNNYNHSTGYCKRQGIEVGGIDYCPWCGSRTIEDKTRQAGHALNTESN